jgi:hypothetical protein
VHEVIVVSAPACPANSNSAPTAIGATFANILPMKTSLVLGSGCA